LNDKIKRGNVEITLVVNSLAIKFINPVVSLKILETPDVDPEASIQVCEAKKKQNVVEYPRASLAESEAVLENLHDLLSLIKDFEEFKEPDQFKVL